MKLHLPKLLRVAVLAAVCCASFAPTVNAKTITLATSGDKVTESGDVIVGSGEYIGYKNDEGVLYVDYVNGTKTQDLEITGSLTINGGNVSVGGGTTVSNNLVGAKLTVSGEVEVNGGSLAATVTHIGSLTIKSGSVVLHAGGSGTEPFGQGNSSSPSKSTSSTKMSHIEGLVTIEGGSLIGGISAGAYITKGIDAYHATTSFKGGISQLGGIMMQRGDTLIGSGITQSGSASSEMYYTDNLALNSDTFNINQSNSNATLVIDRIVKSYNGSSKKYTVNITQSGSGFIQLAQGSYFTAESTININQTGKDGRIFIGGGITEDIVKKTGRQDDENDNNGQVLDGNVDYYDSSRKKFTSDNTVYTIVQSGSDGMIALKNGTYAYDEKGDAAKAPLRNANIVCSSIVQKAGNTIELEENTTLLTSEATIGGTINVDSAATFGVAFDTLTQEGAAPVSFTGSGSLVWASDSKFGVSFTKAAQAIMTEEKDVAGTDEQDFKFEHMPIADGGIAVLQGLDIELIGMDKRLWSVVDADWKEVNGEAYVYGTLVFNPWIKQTASTGESFADVNSYLRVGLEINKNITLSGASTHSLGTKIIGASVALSNSSALGRGPVITSGTTSLATTGTITAKLYETIQNSGKLTLSGKYSAGIDALNISGSVQDTFAVYNTDSKVWVESSSNGFAAEKTDRILVAQDSSSKVTCKAGLTISIGDNKVTVSNDYTFNGENVVIPGILEMDKTVYYMNTEDHNANSYVIWQRGCNNIEMSASAGVLTVDKDISVDAKGGTIVPKSGFTVKGSISNARIAGEGGTVSADLTEQNTLTGKLIVTGDASGSLNLAAADVTLGDATVLSGATVTTSGETSLTTADGVTASLTKGITNTGKLTLSGNYDLSEMDGVDAKAYIDVYGNVVEVEPDKAMNGFAQYDRFKVEVVKKGKADAELILGGTDVKYTKETRATVGTLTGVLDKEGWATFVDGTNYEVYEIGDSNHVVSVSQIQDASNDQTSKVVMSNGSLTADESIEVDTTGGTLITEGDDTVVSGTIEDTIVSAQGGEISGAIKESTITANGGEISGAIEESTITANGGEISGAIKESTITANGGEISGAIEESTITAKGGEISGAVSGGTLDVSGEALVSGAVTGSEITAKGGEISGAVSGGTLMTEAGSLISGSVTNTAITSKGGEISGTIGGTSSLTAMAGVTTLSGSGNSYNGGTVVKDGATLVVTGNSGLGTGGVTVESGATLDMQTDGNAQIEGDLTVNDNGTITLNNGSLLVVDGSVTLNDGAIIILEGEYDLNSALVSSTTGALTMGDVTLVYNGTTVELEMQNGQIVLVSKFKQDKANAATLSNWGIATASRAVVNAVRGQRSNTGCIANGKGTAWVASLGSKHEINGSDINISGAAVGADMKVGRNSRIGIALGYAEGEVQPAGFSQVDQEGSYVAVYGEHGLKKLSATSCLSMDWVAAYGTTDSEVGGLKWEQDSLQLNSRVNWNKKVNNRLCMSVFGGLEYFANNSDTVDGMKTGSIQNLRGEIGVGARYVAWGTPAVTDGKSGLVLAKGCEKLVLNGEVRYMNDMVRSNPVIRMNGLSGMGQNPGRQGIGIEVGATYRIGERWSATANYGFNTMEDSKEPA